MLMSNMTHQTFNDVSVKHVGCRAPDMDGISHVFQQNFFVSEDIV